MTKTKKLPYESNATSTQTTSVADSPDIQAYRALNYRSDPSVAQSYVNEGRRIDSEFQNPYGPASTPYVREAMMRDQHADLQDRAAQGQERESQRANNFNLAKAGGLAELTASRTTTGSGHASGYNSQVVPSIWAALLQGASR